MILEAVICAALLIAVVIGVGAAIDGASAGSARDKARSVAAMLGWAMLYGAAADAAIAWATAGAPVMDYRLSYWLGLIYLSVFASSLAFWLYYRIIRAIGPAKAAYSSVLIPIIAMILSTLFEGYRWSPLALAGGALGLAGLLIALREGPSPPPAVPEAPSRQ